MTAGLNGLQANLLTELLVGWEPFAYTASRGWSPEAMQAGMASLEALAWWPAERSAWKGAACGRSSRRSPTGAQPVVDAFGDDLPALVETLDGWSQRIIDKGWFPARDRAKRASARGRPAGRSRLDQHLDGPVARTTPSGTPRPPAPGGRCGHQRFEVHPTRPDQLQAALVLPAAAVAADPKTPSASWP